MGKDRIPFTLIGGYLGAGKTTLVNHLLRHADGVRLAVLVNEFGALPIDGDLIENQSGNVISIAGGCVCCSYGNDLILAMSELAEMEPRVDHVLLEASGVGIPGAIAATIGLMDAFALDGIVVLADAETIRASVADRYMGDTVQSQLHHADIIILNKADLVPQEALQDVRAWLGAEAPEARIVTATRASLPPATVLESFLGRERALSNAEAIHAADGFKSVKLDAEETIDPEAFAQSLIDAGFIRAKGFVRRTDGTLATIQVVGKRWDVTNAPDGVKPGVVGIALTP